MMTKKLFGLLGKNITYSFSKKYFTTKFIAKNIAAKYVNFDVDSLVDFLPILDEYIFKLKGFNVTTPYKTTIFKYLDEIDEVAKNIGAVNTVKIIDKTYLKGYNTDCYGFKKSIESLLEKQHKKALILGSGGASKAIIYVLKQLSIDYLIVSRTPNKKQIAYGAITEKIMESHKIIINATPIGTSGITENECPNLPYHLLNSSFLLYDLIYNPAKTIFLKKGEEKGATIKNGQEMLELQAEKSWEIWNSQ